MYIFNNEKSEPFEFSYYLENIFFVKKNYILVS